MHIERILCPTDFSDTSDHARNHAAIIAGWYAARVAALHVLNETEALSETAIERGRAQTVAHFAPVTAAGIPVEVFVDVGAPAERILNRAVTYIADLLVIGTHGISGFQHLVLGSVTEKVLRMAVCPVLTVPPRAQTASRLPFRQVLCAVDFSDCSLAALAFAVSLAEEANARLTIVHAIEWPWPEPPEPRLEELPVAQGVALAEYRRYCERAR